MDNLLSMLSLARKAGMLTLGEEPVEAQVRAKDARVLLLAKDAADNTTRRCRHFAEVGACIWLRLPFTKEELGRAVGRTSVALAALTEVGFAAAYVRKLADRDPEQYGQAAERLELKAQRAAQRKAEQKAHEKNLRQGKVRHKKAEAGAAAQASAPAAKTDRPSSADPRSRRAAHGQEGRRPGRPRRSPGGERPRRSPYANSRPVKKGKGSFRKKEG